MSQDQNLVQVLNDKVSPTSYPEPKQYYDHLLELYKLYVATAESISSRRGLSNTFFLTLNTLVVTAVGILIENGLSLQPKWVVVLPLAALLTLCWTWWRLNLSYKQLNIAKYQVIDAFERSLPARPFVEAEWKLLGEGKDSKRYRELTDAENIVPMIFALLYSFAALMLLFS